MFYEAIVEMKKKKKGMNGFYLHSSAGEFHLRGFGHWPCRKIP